MLRLDPEKRAFLPFDIYEQKSTVRVVLVRTKIRSSGEANVGPNGVKKSHHEFRPMDSRTNSWRT